ncbi:MAG: hypothetical protein L6282_02800 [Candidatus Methanoperedenaceae archaeon]|nr:hypothetical protein [Candidatus Methanoperedenaceae archaeon]
MVIDLSLLDALTIISFILNGYLIVKEIVEKNILSKLVEQKLELNKCHQKLVSDIMDKIINRV